MSISAYQVHIEVINNYKCDFQDVRDDVHGAMKVGMKGCLVKTGTVSTAHIILLLYSFNRKQLKQACISVCNEI